MIRDEKANGRYGMNVIMIKIRSIAYYDNELV